LVYSIFFLFNTIFSNYEPCQDIKNCQCFRDHLCPYHQCSHVTGCPNCPICPPTHACTPAQSPHSNVSKSQWGGRLFISFSFWLKREILLAFYCKFTQMAFCHVINFVQSWHNWWRQYVISPIVRHLYSTMAARDHFCHLACMLLWIKWRSAAPWSLQGHTVQVMEVSMQYSLDMTLSVWREGGSGWKLFQWSQTHARDSDSHHPGAELRYRNMLWQILSYLDLDTTESVLLMVGWSWPELHKYHK